MKKILLLFICLLSLTAKGQLIMTWEEINSLKIAGQLSPGTVYKISNLNKMELISKTSSSFYEIPYRRTVYAMDFDHEFFNFDTKTITGVDDVACVARCTNGIWNLINDAGHKPYRITHCSNNLMVYFEKVYDKVISVSTDIDETYSGSNLGVSCGASVGLSYVAVWFHKTILVNGAIQKTQMTLQEASITGANVFILGKMSKQIVLSLQQN